MHTAHFVVIVVVFHFVIGAQIPDKPPSVIQHDIEQIREDFISAANSTSTSTTERLKHFIANGKRKPNLDRKSKLLQTTPANFHQPISAEWKCPNISGDRDLECGCDMPHTVRCSGDIHSLAKIAEGLRRSPDDVSLLDCTLKNVTFLSDERIFANVSLHGLVISSGEIKRVHRAAFQGLKTPLQALGLPNNALLSVPWNSLVPLAQLERLDLSNNRIKVLSATDFASLPHLNFLDLCSNQISRISLRAFAPLQQLAVLKMTGNRLADFASSLQAIGQSRNLRQLDLQANSLAGPLTSDTLPELPALESLNLDRNSLTSIQNGALQNYRNLVTLSLRHNQIDVLQDHAFSGLAALQSLDLAYNGIVAVSGASLQHLSGLLVLDLTHNFLRTLTQDLTVPLPALRQLRLDGNDISNVARNALDVAGQLQSLSLQDNPLACDCTLRAFSEWLTASKIDTGELLGAICATPPHLEGAPLLQIPPESLSCESERNTAREDEELAIDRLLDSIGQRQMGNLSVQDWSDSIGLKRVRMTRDYGVVLQWNLVNVAEVSCEAVFVYKVTDDSEVLMADSPIKCESYPMESRSMLSVILHETGEFRARDSYRFCLVLFHIENDQHRTPIIACSNQTQFGSEESDDKVIETRRGEVAVKSEPNRDSLVLRENPAQQQRIESFSRSFLPGLAMGFLIAGLSAMIFVIVRMRRKPRELSVAIRSDPYVKLQQATTSL